MLPSLATRQQGQLAEIQIPCAEATSLLLSSPCTGVAHFPCSVHARTRALCTNRSALLSSLGLGLILLPGKQGALAVAPAMPKMALGGPW